MMSKEKSTNIRVPRKGPFSFINDFRHNSRRVSPIFMNFGRNLQHTYEICSSDFGPYRAFGDSLFLSMYSIVPITLKLFVFRSYSYNQFVHSSGILWTTSTSVAFATTTATTTTPLPPPCVDVAVVLVWFISTVWRSG